MRLIDANWILGEIEHDLGCYEIGKLAEDDGLYVELRDVVKMVCAAPTIDPASLRKKGEWIMKETMIRSPYAKNAYCSECLEETSYAYNFCPNCGCAMEVNNGRN